MVAGGHKTVLPSSITYSPVVSRDSVRIVMTIAALNGLSILGCDIQKAYLAAPCCEKIWTTSGPEFDSESGKKMLVVRVLYRLKSSRAEFRAFLEKALYDLGYKSSVSDPDLWLRPAIKEKDIFKYWEFVLFYVDNVLCISENPMHSMKCIQSKFKLKDDKMEKPDVYLGAELSTMDNNQGGE